MGATVSRGVWAVSLRIIKALSDIGIQKMVDSVTQLARGGGLAKFNSYLDELASQTRATISATDRSNCWSALQQLSTCLSGFRGDDKKVLFERFRYSENFGPDERDPNASGSANIIMYWENHGLGD